MALNVHVSPVDPRVVNWLAVAWMGAQGEVGADRAKTVFGFVSSGYTEAARGFPGLVRSELVCVCVCGTHRQTAQRTGRASGRGVSCELDSMPSREVRRLMRELLTGSEGIVVDDAVLVADELVSNAHRHGRAPRRCRLTLVDGGRSVRIEVDDASPAQPRLRTPDRSGGRGLILVDRLSTSWGVLNHAHPNHPTHKTVWAELAMGEAGNSGNVRHVAVGPTTRPGIVTPDRQAPHHRHPSGLMTSPCAGVTSTPPCRSTPTPALGSTCWLGAARKGGRVAADASRVAVVPGRFDCLCAGHTGRAAEAIQVADRRHLWHGLRGRVQRRPGH